MAANQINITQAAFTVHRETPFGMWFHKKGFGEKAPMKKEEDYTEEELKLQPDDYEVFLNPQLVAETDVSIKDCHPGVYRTRNTVGSIVPRSLASAP